MRNSKVNVHWYHTIFKILYIWFGCCYYYYRKGEKKVNEILWNHIITSTKSWNGNEIYYLHMHKTRYLYAVPNQTKDAKNIKIVKAILKRTCVHQHLMANSINAKKNSNFDLVACAQRFAHAKSSNKYHLMQIIHFHYLVLFICQRNQMSKNNGKKGANRPNTSTHIHHKLMN